MISVFPVTVLVVLILLLKLKRRIFTIVEDLAITYITLLLQIIDLIRYIAEAMREYFLLLATAFHVLLLSHRVGRKLLIFLTALPVVDRGHIFRAWESIVCDCLTAVFFWRLMLLQTLHVKSASAA